MQDLPFAEINCQRDPNWPAKSFFNYVCQGGRLLWALDLITKRWGCSYNEEFCRFPDFDDHDSYFHFEGVMFGVMDNEVILTEARCWEYVREAAAFHIARNSADALVVASMMERIRS